MASRNGSNNVEKHGARPKNTSPKSGSSDSGTTYDSSDFLESSPPVLQPSKDESRTMDGRLKGHFLKRFLTRSLRITPSETAPLLSNEPGEDVAGQEESGNCCIAVFGCYKNLVLKFRRSVCLCFFQLLVCAIPVSAIVMGILFAESCRKVHFLPVFGAVVGAIGAIFTAVWMVASCYNRRGTPCSNRQILLLGVAIFVLLNLTIIDAVFVTSLSPSFDPTSPEYCNETFYTYAFYKEIATAIAVILSAIIYIPGSRHILCCYNCSMRSTPNAFYYSI